jgi:hypothetical protein
LENYVQELYSGTIITDFDEQVNRFEGAVFSLRRVADGTLREAEITRVIDPVNEYTYETVDRAAIQTLIVNQGILNLQKIHIRGLTMQHHGDNISVGDNSTATIINRSNLVNALNSVATGDRDEVKEALERIASVVKESKNEDAVEHFNDLTEELAKPEPKKTRLRSFWDSLAKTLPQIAEMGATTAKIISLFT